MDYGKLDQAENAVKQFLADYRSIQTLGDTIQVIRQGLSEIEGVNEKITKQQAALADLQVQSAAKQLELEELTKKYQEVSELYQTIKNKLAALK